MALDLFRVAGGLQISESSQILEGAAAPTIDAPVGSLFTETSTGALYTKVTAGAGADKWEKLALNSYVVDQVNNLTDMIANLGNAFNYVGTVAGGTDAGTATDLTDLPADQKDAGDYYKVTTAGYFNDGTSTFFANVGDGIIWNISGTVDKIDNTDPAVSAGANITVTGTADVGFTVAVSTAFSDRVTDAEADIDVLETDVATLQTNVSSLTGRVTAVETGLDAEVTARTNADDAIQSELDAVEISVGLAADGTMAGVVFNGPAAGATSLVAAINAVATATGSDVTALITEINTVETAIGLTSGGAFVPFTGTNYINGATSIANGEVLLDSAIKTVSDAVAAEVTARDAAITSAVAAEVTARDAAIASAVAAEVTARDAAVTSAVDAEAVIREAADTTLQSNINAEEAARLANSGVVTGTAVQSLVDTVPSYAAKWLVHIQDVATSTNVTAYEVFAASNGTTVDFNRFGILKLGAGVPSASVTVAQSGTNMIITVTTTSDANITIKRVAVV